MTISWLVPVMTKRHLKLEKKLSTLTVTGATWSLPRQPPVPLVQVVWPPQVGLAVLAANLNSEKKINTKTNYQPFLISSDDEEIPTSPDHIETENVTVQAPSGSAMSNDSDNDIHVDEDYTAMYEGIRYDMMNYKTSTFR